MVLLRLDFPQAPSSQFLSLAVKLRQAHFRDTQASSDWLPCLKNSDGLADEPSLEGLVFALIKSLHFSSHLRVYFSEDLTTHLSEVPRDTQKQESFKHT